MNRLRGCATHQSRKCGGTHWIGHASRSMGGAYYCPACLALIFAEFDPQPGDKVHFIDGPQTDYVVVSRDGDDIAVRRQGYPDDPDRVTRVATLWGLNEWKAPRKAACATLAARVGR